MPRKTVSYLGPFGSNTGPLGSQRSNEEEGGRHRGPESSWGEKESQESEKVQAGKVEEERDKRECCMERTLAGTGTEMSRGTLRWGREKKAMERRLARDHSWEVDKDSIEA